MFAFGDSFDLYTAASDVSPGFWDTYTAGFGSLVGQPGRFAGGRSWGPANNWSFSKSSGQNDAVHHINLAFIFTSAISGTTQGTYFTFRDGATAQATVAIRSDGSLALYSGSNGGTLLDTYSLNPMVNQWFVFEVEVVINNTTGSWTIKKSGNTGTADHTLGSLNTRAGTSNNYANALIVGMGATGFGNFNIDDLFWRSDPSAVPWAGDIRSYTRMPSTDVTVQFTRGPNPPNQTVVGGTGAMTPYGANTVHYVSFTAAASGSVPGGTVRCDGSGGGGTGHFKVALFSANTDGSVGTLLATATEITNPGNAVITITFPSPARVLQGQNYWFGINQDASITYNNQSSTAVTLTQTYASWPVSNPGGVISTANCPGCVISFTAQYNADMVSEHQQDGTTTYVYDSNVGDADFYGIASLPTTPASTICVTTRAFLQKSDAGTRSSAVQLKSGSTTVTSPSTPMTTGVSWNYRTDFTDRPTGAAWTATGVNNVQIGPIVTV